MSVVLLEDKHENAEAWKPVDNSQEPKDDTIKVGSDFALKLTLGVGIFFALVVVGALFGPHLMRRLRLYRSASVKPKGKTKRQQPLVSRRVAPAEMEDVEEDEDDEEEEEDEDGEEEEEEEEEEEAEADLATKFPVGSEAKAVNLKERKYQMHNQKVGVVKKVDARAGKLYLEMKASGARLVLREANVVPVDHSSRGTKARGGRRKV